MEGRVVTAVGLAFVLTAILSGPLVGAVDFTRDDRIAQPGAGTAEVTVEHVPTEQMCLTRERFGAGRYRLAAPPASIDVEAVDGNPVLRYVVDVPELWIAPTTRYELGAVDSNTLRPRPEPISISPDRVNAASYTGYVRIWLRTDERTIDRFSEQITLEVCQ